MPAVNPVPSLLRLSTESLLDLCLSLFHDRNVASCGSWSEELYCSLSSYLTPPVYEIFFNKLLEKLSDIYQQHGKKLDKKIREFVPNLVGSQLTSMDFTDLSLVTDKEVMKRIYSRVDSACPSLEHLAMGQSFFFHPELVSDLNSRLARLPRLTSLRLMYIATDAIITDLGNICPRLREVSLKGSANITDAAAVSLVLCQNMTSLDIQGTKVSGQGCLQIIENCPKLEWIEHCPFNCDSDFKIFKSRTEMFDLIKKFYLGDTEVEEAERKQISEEQQFNIKNFWLFNPKSEELILALLCPQLEKVRLDFIFTDTSLSLDSSPLAKLKNMSTLDLNFYDNHRTTLFRHILSVCGSQLKTLIYNVCADYRSVVECHNIIATKCPNLTSLTFIGDYENPAHNDDETDSLLLQRSPEFSTFHSQLEHLTLGGYCTDGRLAWLLMSATKIKTIYLDGNLEKLTNSAWFTIQATNPLQNLESVWFNTSTDMTMEAVETLLQNSTKLKKLGRLIHLREHAHGQRRENYLELLERGRRENWDIDFTWVSPRRTTLT